MGARYALVLLAVATLIAADQAVLQPLLVRMNGYAPAINLAGRQRMLSQKLAKAALALAAADRSRASRRVELDESLAQWTAAHHALRFGDKASGVPKIASAELDDAWRQLEPRFVALRTAVERVIDESRGPWPTQGAAAAVAAVVDREAAFLLAMERIVKMMEDRAAEELARVRSCALGIALAIVALLIGLGWFVIRPALSAIHGQVDELENRVALRTRELEDALASLQREMHQRERTEQRNKCLAAQLAHADRVESMGRLAAGLAHELNQPLGAIANYAEACLVVLADSGANRAHDSLLDYAKQIQEASLRAGHIVRRIRNYVRPGLGQAEVVELRALVHEVVELCRPEAARAEVEFHLTSGAKDESILVSVDPIQIQQVLVNLVQNAIQAMTHSPPRQRRLVVRTSAANGAAQVDVIDGGPGLACDDVDLLFTPFHTTKADGLGLGLSICRSIVEHHRGTIWAKSLPGRGAQFSFVLPLADRHAEQPSQFADSVCR